MSTGSIKVKGTSKLKLPINYYFIFKPFYYEFNFKILLSQDKK